MKSRDWLFRRLTRPPFRDADGRKGWLTPFTRAQPHRVWALKLILPGWPRFPDALRIAFLADFHVGGHAHDVARLQRIVAEVSGRRPDLVLLGGDFVNMIPFGGGRVPPETIAAVLAELDAPLGRIAVLGNHDRNYGEDAVAAALRAHGTTVLFDEAAERVFAGTSIAVAGIHDARRDRPTARSLLQRLSPRQPALILAPDPWWFGHLPAGPHVMLAGHTHGGQICLPLVGPVRNASWAPLRWSHGLIEEEGRRMLVTSGLGCSAIPFRLLMPPEYVMLELNGTGA